MSRLNIFVSSTCYDLSQIRTDLHESIFNLGFNPVLSEFGTFPINPSNNTVENCVEAVNASADIFVLILGKRYGHKLDSGKSITNLEFITARNKNIPIYVFITRGLLNILPVYLMNKTSDYSSVVDNPEIFEFANEVRNSGLWNHEFETFQDIINTLKIQLSFLFKESLTLRNKFYANPNLDFHSKLSSKALKIILIKEAAFEYEFFAQVLVDEIGRFEILKNDYEYKIILKNDKQITTTIDFTNWISGNLASIQSYMTSLNNLMNEMLPKYLNELGKPSDLKGLYYTAHTYARIFESLLNWSINIQSVSVSENQTELRDIVAEISSLAITQIWDFAFEVRDKILNVKKRLQGGESNISENYIIVLNADPVVMKRFNNAITNYKHHN